MLASTPAHAAPLPKQAGVAGVRDRLPEDEVIYLVMPDRFANGDPANDRGGLTGDRMQTGYDPKDKGFFHGGDLKGVVDKLDYMPTHCRHLR